MSSRLAAQCFEENLADYVKPQTDGERYNLYNGLRALAEAVDSVDRRIQNVDAKLDLIIQKIDRFSS
jgi:hypothetical protein